MNIIAISNVSLHVKSLAQSLDFYTNVLRLSRIDRPDTDFDGVWLKINETQYIYLIEGRKHKVNFGPQSTHFSFEVDSVRDMEKQFIRNNIAYTGPKVRPDGNYQLFVHDPDGYCIEFYQPKVE